MKPTSKRAQILLVALLLPACCQAMSPPTPRPDKTATITRDVDMFFAFQQDIICVKRPAPRPDYEPGRLHIGLFAPELNFSADLEIWPYQIGYECVKVSIPNKLADKYQLEIIDITKQQPWHQFFVGRLIDIKANSKAAP